MSAALAPDVRLFVAGFRRESAYRAAMLAGLAANSVFGFIRVAVFGAVVAGAAGTSGTLAGYTTATIVTYTWLSQALIGPLRLWETGALAERLRTGDIAVDLTRPLSLLRLHLGEDLGRCTATIIPRSLPILLVAAVTTGLTLPGDPALRALGALSIAVAVLVSALSRYTLQLLGFWIIELRGVRSLYQGLAGLLAGLVVPVPLMPDWLATAAWATPFPAMMQIPADLLGGRASGAGAAALAVGIQLAWVAGLLALASALTVAGRRRLVVQGG